MSIPALQANGELPSGEHQASLDEVEARYGSSSKRRKLLMKNKYGLDFFIANITETGSGLPFPKFFQVNRHGDPKGIIVVKLGGSV